MISAISTLRFSARVGEVVLDLTPSSGGLFLGFTNLPGALPDV